MNILMDELPYTVTIAGHTVPINTDYRTGIYFEQCLADEPFCCWRCEYLFEKSLNCFLDSFANWSTFASASMRIITLRLPLKSCSEVSGPNTLLKLCAVFYYAVVKERKTNMNIEINGVTLQGDFMDAGVPMGLNRSTFTKVCCASSPVWWSRPSSHKVKRAFCGKNRVFLKTFLKCRKGAKRKPWLFWHRALCWTQQWLMHRFRAHCVHPKHPIF